MTATAATLTERGRLTLGETLADSRVMATRQLRKILRRPMYVGYLFVQPVIFVLLFRYVFGSAINTGRVSWCEPARAGVSMRRGTVSAGDECRGAVDVLRRPRAVLVSPTSELAQSDLVTVSELRDHTFVVNPRSLAPEALEGLKLMCREFGGFDAKVPETAMVACCVSDGEGCPIRDHKTVAIMPDATARSARPDLAVVVPVQAPPQYVLALGWPRGEHAPQAQRFVDYLRSYRDEHGW